ncbi:MAG: acyl-CoA thioesterase [Chlorobia bacterium]|nr:acyl-CoA thioesterase [Fimbriimonadaceae bacterium]
MTPIPVSHSRVEMAQIMQPNDANFLGKVFGGRILEMIDLCAYAASSKHAGRICVTASFDRVDFHEPINVSELVTMIGCVTYVGRTSLEVTIEVYAQNLQTSDKRHTNTARVTMVALDANGKPVAVPGLVAETRDDKLRFLQGKLRRELRTEQRDEFDSKAAAFAIATDQEIEDLLAAEKLS